MSDVGVNSSGVVRWLRLLLLVGLIAGCMSARQSLARPLVERVSFHSRSDGQGYVVRFHTTETVSAYHDPKKVGDRQLEITLYYAGLASSYEAGEAQGPVQKYTVQSKKGHLVFRFTLAPSVDVDASVYRDRSSSDLLMGLNYPEMAPRAQVEEAVRAVTASSEQTASKGGERWKLDTIVIDAGHGGHDPGAQAYGLDEKDVVLSIARKLGAYIDQKTEMDVVYTRRTDRFVELRERGRIANRKGGKLFVSIHANAARNRRARGTETYFLGMHKTETARRVMERENSVINLEDNPQQYEQFGGSAIMQSLAQSAYMRKSEQLAGLVQQQFEEHVDRKNRGVKQAGFLVLWAASMPAILVETGFITNRHDASFLRSDRGQTEIAGAIFQAIRSYKAQYEKGLDLAARN